MTIAITSSREGQSGADRYRVHAQKRYTSFLQSVYEFGCDEQAQYQEFPQSMSRGLTLVVLAIIEQAGFTVRIERSQAQTPEYPPDQFVCFLASANVKREAAEGRVADLEQRCRGSYVIRVSRDAHRVQCADEGYPWHQVMIHAGKVEDRLHAIPIPIPIRIRVR